MTSLIAGDPALTEFVLTTGLSLGLLASAALTIAALPWSERELAEVDRAAQGLLALQVRRVLAFSRSATVRG